ncbi:MAG: hypothetical protein IJV14_12315 [Lachnospiraceae bacterium]|nr:hypothetical protein [Lachnospiraceae bacterium]
MDFEKEARKNHRRGMSCAGAVYQAFYDVNPKKTGAPSPRSEGGKCGAVLAAEKTLREMGINRIEDFDQQFTEIFGSLKCSELLGKRNGSCNDFVGISAAIVEKMI